ncbi:hypothetical protein WICPIJ_007088 [Wickerhamomyces pijperi]|uniref:Uncharacterized protein n=1 Tax=Wickerhamomyces pijperi TaxID=599730 RepID=A0A9P8TKE0_WICPI|nr:hypothetical protein WICPIJ_007088 [Wickerhamomyces pijperi]
MMMIGEEESQLGCSVKEAIGCYLGYYGEDVVGENAEAIEHDAVLEVGQSAFGPISDWETEPSGLHQRRNVETDNALAHILVSVVLDLVVNAESLEDSLIGETFVVVFQDVHGRVHLDFGGEIVEVQVCVWFGGVDWVSHHLTFGSAVVAGLVLVQLLNAFVETFDSASGAFLDTILFRRSLELAALCWLGQFRDSW